MLEALEEHFGESAHWTTPRGGLFVWATLDQRIDTTDLLALARKTDGVAFVPGRAAYMDGRRGSSSMRLNFAGVSEQDIREGIRRIGRSVREQLGLLGSLTGSHPTPSKRSDAQTRTGDAGGEGAYQEQLADVVALPRREDGTPARRRSDR
jgi:2-aminoadipate transaminase